MCPFVRHKCLFVRHKCPFVRYMCPFVPKNVIYVRKVKLPTFCREVLIYALPRHILSKNLRCEAQPQLVTAWAAPRVPGQMPEQDLIEAARQGNLARVEQLLATGDHDIDETDGEGATPLILASMAGHLHLVQVRP